jgi:hypothetical protein
MYDELELDKLGDRKTALFLIMSDTDSTFNFLIKYADIHSSYWQKYLSGFGRLSR